MIEKVKLKIVEDGRNVPFSDGLKLFERYYIGPVKMPLELFHRGKFQKFIDNTGQRPEETAEIIAEYVKNL